MRAAFFLIAVSLALPSAAAQSLEPRLDLRITGTNELLEPETGVAEFQLVLTVTCPLRRDPTQPWTVTWEKTDVPRYATVILNPSATGLTFDGAKCADPNYRESRTSVVTVTTNREAPAFQDLIIKVRATVRQQELTNSTTGEAMVINGFVPLTQIRPASLFQKVAPGAEIRFPMDVTNLGNGDARVQFVAERVSAGNITWQAPEPLTVRPKMGQPSARYVENVVLRGNAPAAGLYTNSIHSVTLNIQSRATDPRDQEVEDNSITFSVQVQGGGGGSPSLGAPTLLLALVVVLALLRGRSPRTREPRGR